VEMIKITFHRNKCIGCYYCNEVAPYRWDIDEDDGRSILVDSEDNTNNDIYTVVTSDDEQPDNEEAALQCPTGVIRVENVS